MKGVCVILVNYKTWRDTIECLESLLASNTKDMQVVVVENGSPDDSWNQLQNWAQGKVINDLGPNNPLEHLSNPPAEKPIQYSIIEDSEIKELSSSAPVVFIRSKSNTGFAGGNNIGLRYMLHNDFNYAWLLNNDTVIERDAVNRLVELIEASNEKIGIVGSKLRLYHKPDTLQGLGAIFNKYSGKSKIIGAQQVDHGQFNHQTENITYAIGAAMFVSRNFLQEVGLMSEEYFLYNEENDWSARAHQKGWKVAVATSSIVYHKQGASTGNSPKKSKLQIKALNYKYRGKILLYKKYYKPQLLFLYLHLIKRSFRYILKGNLQEASVIYGAIFNTKFEK